jgi:hypothetical protein
MNEPEATKVVDVKHRDGWHLEPRWVRLACPTCGITVDVLPGSQAWCTRHTSRPEMKGGS